MPLTVLDAIPDGLLEKPASALHQQLDGPTLIHLEGRRRDPLFVSVLQHGNEFTGWEAIRRLLKSQYRDRDLPRSLSFLIGNVQAARHQRRRLDDQPDYNRCWPVQGAADPRADNEIREMFRQVTEMMAARRPMASVDIHNNTGLNPHYAAINRMDYRFFHLARLFSETMIFFRIPGGVQSNAFAEFCPSVTLECGQAGEIHGTDHSLEYLDTLLNLERLPEGPIPDNELSLFHMVATVTIDPEVGFGFNGDDASLVFPSDLDHLNFSEQPAGTALGRVQGLNQLPLQAIDFAGHNVTGDYFAMQDGQLTTLRPLMPSMLTTDARVIRQDCLCYLMERIDTAIHRPAGSANLLGEPLADPAE